MQDWFIYVIRCKYNSLYVGVTTDVLRRFEEHEGNGKKCAKYLRGRGPLVLSWQKKIGEKSLAFKLESKVKLLSRNNKEKLLVGKLDIWDLTRINGS